MKNWCVRCGCVKNLTFFYSFNVKDVENTASNVKILTERGEEIYTITNKNKNREYVTKEEIPQILKDAVVATEDKTYYKHSGVSQMQEH